MLLLVHPQFCARVAARSPVCWWACLRRDRQILKEFGPQLKDLKKGEVILLDGGFPRRKHGVVPYPKPKNTDHPKWQAKYNNGHSFIWGRGERPFAQLYTPAVSGVPKAGRSQNGYMACYMLGMGNRCTICERKRPKREM